MDILQNFLENNNLHNSEDIDALLECASVARELVSRQQYQHIAKLINYTIEKGYFEAFAWAAGIVQEELVKEESHLNDFYCYIGRKIANYDDFVQNLQVDFNSIKNYIEKIYDKNGEVEAFFNVMVYKTCFENIFFVSAENFDNKDNDYIQYKLLFTRDRESYIN